MKKIISFLLAFVLVFSAVPMATFAAPGDPLATLGVKHPSRLLMGESFGVGGTLTTSPYDDDTVPKIYIKFNDDHTLNAADYLIITIELENAVWSLPDCTFERGSNLMFESDSAAGQMKAGSRAPEHWCRESEMIRNLSDGIPARAHSGVGNAHYVLEYELSGATSGSSTAYLNVKIDLNSNFPQNELSKDFGIFIPMYTKAIAPGEMRAKISSSTSHWFTYSSDPVVYAYAYDESTGAPDPDYWLDEEVRVNMKTETTIVDTPEFERVLNVDDINIRELVREVISSGDKVIELRAPKGFEWIADRGGVGGVGGLSGIEAKQNAFSFGKTNGITDKSLLRVALKIPYAGRASAGELIISGLRLVATDKAVLGDVMVAVSGANVTPESVRAGLYVAETNTTELPQIVAGAYPKNWYSSHIRSVCVSLEEEVLSALYAGKEIKFTVSDGAKIRGVQFADVENINSLSVGNYIANDYFEEGANVLIDKAGREIASIDIEDGTYYALKNLAREDKNKPAALKMQLYLSVRPDYAGNITLTASEDGVDSSLMSADIAVAAAPFTSDAARDNVSVSEASQSATLNSGGAPVEFTLKDITITETLPGSLNHSGGFSYMKDVLNKQGDFDKLLLNIPGVTFEEYTVTDSLGVASAAGEPKGGAIAISVDAQYDEANTVLIQGIRAKASEISHDKYPLLSGGIVCANYSDEETPRFATFSRESITVLDEYLDFYPPVISLTQSSSILRVTRGEKDEYTRMHTAPYVSHDGTFMVPLYWVMQVYGVEPSYDENTKTASFTYNGRRVLFTEGVAQVIIDGKAEQISSAVSIKDDRMFVPVYTLGERVLEAEVIWDGNTRTFIYR